MKLILSPGIAHAVEPHLPVIAPGCSVVHVDRDGAPDGDLSDAEVFLRWQASNAALRRVVNAAARLRWIHTSSAGVDRVLTPEMIERNIMLTNSAGAHAIPIAEFVMLFMLGHAKQVHELVRLKPENTWEQGKRLPMNELYGRTVLIVGLGHIGQEIARRVTSFGMRVVGSRRHPQPMAGVERIVGAEAWAELLPDADYVVIAAPLTEETRGMFDAAAFARMKRDAYLINIARGEIVDTGALLAALHEQRIAGAGLDVLPEEPLPPDHPLWNAPNVWITPHISWASPRMEERTVAVFLENLRRYCAGEPLINLVDKAAGY